MQHRKQEKVRQETQAKERGYIICQMCGRKNEPDACVWQEDDGGSIYCYDCTAERESCGCSD